MTTRFANAWGVEAHGRVMRRRQATVLLVEVLLVFGYAALSVSVATSSGLEARMVIVFGAALVVCMSILAIRSWAVRAARVGEAEAEAKAREGGPQDQDSTGPDLGREPSRLPTAGGTVITCSGGGIKSASFCLGALAALDDAKIYRDAKALVAVSGGGYAASAFSALAADKEKPFLPTSEELLRLRNRTNYLAGSSRARFEMTTSLLAGLVLNVLMLAATGVALVWLIVNYSSALGLVATAAPHPPGDVCAVEIAAHAPLAAHCPWTYGDPSRWWWALAPTVVLGGLAVCLFIWDRTGAEKPWTLALSGRAPDNWWSNTPNTLVSAALVWLLVVPGLLWLSIAAHNTSLNPALPVGAILDEHKVVLGGLTVGSIWAFVRSAIKGLRRRPDRSTFWGSVLAGIRSSIAPLFALGLILVLVLGCAAAYGAYAMTTPVVRGAVEPQWAGSESWTVIALAMGVFVLVGFCTLANHTSMHIFYRDRLAYAYLNEPSPPEGKQRGLGLGFDCLPTPHRDCSRGPRLVLCGTANLLDDDLVPTGRNGTSFLMSADEVGLSACRMPQDLAPNRGVQTQAPRQLPPGGSLTMSQYRKRVGRDVTVAQAMAISGAAVAPVAGREGRMRPFRILFALVNVRLGVWLPNPYWNHSRDYRGLDRWVMSVDRKLSAPSGLQVLAEAFSRIGLTDPYLYVSDGGHYDNLGLVEALRDRPDRVIVLDGSGDAEDRFPTIGRAIATARMDLGVNIDFDPSVMMRGKGERPQQAHVVAYAEFEGGHTCRIDYIKCVLPPRMPWDLEAYRLEHKDFPATSSSLEMYDEFDFEAFHHLGYEVIRRAALRPSAPKDLPAPLAVDARSTTSTTSTRERDS
ncbi:hypothetical protein [Terrabacter sp. Ter38]|uniref:hypothetical protein n=1 Tax=Terrabacter sp. Ter38 TaxID=2926030 RepID=UPI0021174BA5|nr:hypothetical protein [Terrabacter sp. Ter38]